jgi:hypothetical protein
VREKKSGTIKKCRREITHSILRMGRLNRNSGTDPLKKLLLASLQVLSNCEATNMVSITEQPI